MEESHYHLFHLVKLKKMSEIVVRPGRETILFDRENVQHVNKMGVQSRAVPWPFVDSIKVNLSEHTGTHTLNGQWFE